MIVRHATELERAALGRPPVVCEYGVPLATHPPLPRPLPWAHGRPCDRPTDFRRYDDGAHRDEGAYR